MTNFNGAETGARRAPVLLLLATAALACDGSDDGSRKDSALILIEGVPQGGPPE